MKKTFGIAFILGLIISTFASIVIAANVNADQSQNQSPQYKVNDSGQTYGSGIYAVSFETEPDLIAAVGTDGTEGYVYAKDLHKDMPQTPEEAVAQTNKLRKSQSLKRGSNETIVVDTIPLYDVDGKTIIGEFSITNTMH